MAPESEKICERAVSLSPTTPVERQATAEAEPKNKRTKATRHPRWTREETIILIEAKKLVEKRGESVWRCASASGCVQSDPKWDLISAFCLQQGVKRGPVQCRKRWGNLLTDFRKIKKWESGIKEEGESFWMMRNDRRKAKKLPGFYDTEVYKVLDGGVCTAAAFPLTLIKMTSKAENGYPVEGEGSEQCGDEEEEKTEAEAKAEAIVDGENMGWSTEEENIEINANPSKINTPLKTSVPKETITRGSPNKTPTPTFPLLSPEKQHQASCQGNYDPGCQREPMSQEGYKRRRFSPDNCKDTTNFSNNITKVLRKNSNMLKAHLGAQNINYQLARNQQKEQTDSLVAVLSKLTDALTKIADKL